MLIQLKTELLSCRENGERSLRSNKNQKLRNLEKWKTKSGY